MDPPGKDTMTAVLLTIGSLIPPVFALCATLNADHGMRGGL